MRGRIEALIGLAAPVLDLVLAAGDRISRIAEPDDRGYLPVRRGPEGSFLGSSSSPRIGAAAPQRPPASE